MEDGNYLYDLKLFLPKELAQNGTVISQVTLRDNENDQYKYFYLQEEILSKYLIDLRLPGNLANISAEDVTLEQVRSRNEYQIGMKVTGKLTNAFQSQLIESYKVKSVLASGSSTTTDWNKIDSSGRFQLNYNVNSDGDFSDNVRIDSLTFWPVYRDEYQGYTLPSSQDVFRKSLSYTTKMKRATVKLKTSLE